MAQHIYSNDLGETEIAVTNVTVQLNRYGNGSTWRLEVEFDGEQVLEIDIPNDQIGNLFSGRKAEAVGKCYPDSLQHID